ncbi:MAG: hypothetical protein AABX11_05935 [Nanoarchaeota archaeon]
MKKRGKIDDETTLDVYSYLKLKEEIYECLKCGEQIEKGNMDKKEGLCDDCFDGDGE